MHFVFFACGVSILLFACSQLLTKDKEPVHYCMAFACFILSYILIYFWAVDAGFSRLIPAALVSSDISATFLSGPAFYLASLTILDEGRRPVRSYTAYFVAPAIFAVGFGIYNAFVSPPYLPGFASIPSHFASPLLTALTAGSYGSITAAILLDLLAARRLSRTEQVSRARIFRTQVVFLFLYLAASFLPLAGIALRSDRLIALGVFVSGLIALGFTLTCTSIMYFSRGAIDSPMRPVAAKPEWDSLSGELSARLERLMAESVPYRDENLTAAVLARMLDVDPKRLSYHLRTAHGSGFRGYINDWRLQAVGLDLVREPRRSILDIAFENGFNSKSSFNTLFVKKYGMTPREYRKAAQAHAQA